MATQNATNTTITNNADGFDMAGGSTARKLTVTGADITLTGSGSNTYTFPSETDTLLGDKDVPSILEQVYPVGSIYINATNSTNPATLLGFGTWSAFGAGRVLVGFDSSDTDFDTAEETGGAKTHTLTIAEMPDHRHSMESSTDSGDTWSLISGAGFGKDGAITGNYLGVSQSVTAFSSFQARVRGAGGGESHNNLQPYITVYMWKRTA